METRWAAANGGDRMRRTRCRTGLHLLGVFASVLTAAFGKCVAGGSVASVFAAPGMRLSALVLPFLLSVGLSKPQGALAGGLPEGLSIGPSQVLLPWVPPSHAAEFPAVRAQLQLEGNKGSTGGGDVCFYWAIQNPQVLSLLHPDCSSVQPAAQCRLDGSSGGSWAAAGAPSSGGSNSCFSRVLVEAVPQGVGRRASSWIFASAEKEFSAEGPSGAPSEGASALSVSRRGFRAQVLVAPIVRLSFSTRDKRLAIGQLGDVSLLGYDAEGNVFSSLEGIPFLWEVQGEDEVVVVEPVETDAVAGTIARRRVEEMGAQEQKRRNGPRWRSDAIVLRGKSTGRATIRARLAMEQYRDVPPAEVAFLVHELVALSPAALLVPPAAVFALELHKLWEDGRQEALSLPNAHFGWSAEDISVFSSLSGSALSSTASSASSTLLQVTDGGVVTVTSPQQATEGPDLLTGRALVVCLDKRIGEKQQADVTVLLPTALRLLYEDTEVLSTQTLWKNAAAAAAAAAQTSGRKTAAAAAVEKAVLLRQLLLAEEAVASGVGSSEEAVLSALPPLRLSLAGKQERGLEGTGLILYLVRGREYLFKVELLSSQQLPGVNAQDSLGPRRMLLPSNAVVHWTCEGASKPAEEQEGTGLSPLQKAVPSQQAFVLLRADSLGSGSVRVSLLQVGSPPGPVWMSEGPLSILLPVRVVPPVSFRLLSTHYIVDTAAGTGGLGASSAPMRRLTAPLVLAPGSRFPLEPQGGSGEFVLSSSDPSICAVVYAVPSRAGRLSSSGLVVAGAPVDPTEVFTVEGIAPGVATLLLRDKRQPQNAVLLSVVVAPPVTIELRMQHLLLPVARGDIKTTIQAADRAQEATGVLIALADLTDFLPLLPEASRRWLLAEGDSVGSVPNSQWPQTVEDAREHLLASDAAARPREGTVGMEERLQAASGAAAETGIDVLHPFWVRRSQLASCPDVRFAVEGSAVDITTRAGGAIPFTCGIVSLRGLRKGSSRVTATVPQQQHQQRLQASARIDVYLPVELWASMSSVALPLPPPVRLSSSRTAPLLQRLTQDPNSNSSTSLGVALATTLLQQLDLHAPAAPSGDSADLVLYGAPIAAINSSSTGSLRGVAGEITLTVGGHITVFLKEGPPPRPEAYRHSVTATALSHSFAEVPAAAAADDSETDDEAASVAILPEGSGAVQRFVCLRPSRSPVSVQIKSSYAPKDPQVTSHREEVTSLLLSCAYPELIEVRPLPSLSRAAAAPYGSYADRASKGTLKEALGGLPVASATLAATKTTPLSNSWDAEGVEGPQESEEGLYVQCGAEHAFALFAYDSALRPLHGLASLPTRWSLTPATPHDNQHNKQPNQTDLPVLQVLPRAAPAAETAGNGYSVALLTVSPSLCCGVFALQATVEPPKGAPAFLEAALSRQQLQLLQSSLGEWRAAAAAEREQQLLPLWEKGELRDRLLLFMSPPIRLLPFPAPLIASAAAQAPGQPAAQGNEEQQENFQTVRLPLLPGVASRMLLQFGSPDTEAIRMLRLHSSEKATMPAAALAHGELLTSPNAPLLLCLSTAEASTRYALAQAGDSAAAAAGAAAARRAVGDLQTATDAACAGLAASQEDVSALPLPVPFSFSANPFTRSCPLSSREIFVPPPFFAASRETDPLLQQQQQQQRLPLLHLEAWDQRLLSPWRPRNPSSSSTISMSSSNGPQLVAELQFVRLRSLRLVLLPSAISTHLERGWPATGSAASSAETWAKEEGDPFCPASQQQQQQQTLTEIEAGKIYGLRVEATGDDGLPIDPRFFAAMRLSVVATAADESSSTSSSSGSSRVSGRGRVFLKPVGSQKQAHASPQQQEQQQQAADTYGLFGRGEPLAPYLTEEGDFSSPLAVASYGSAAAAGSAEGAAEFGAPEGWDSLSALPTADFDCFHFFLAATDIRGSFVLHAEALADSPHAAAAAATVSTRLTVRIHPPLQLNPPELVLLPGGHSFELTLHGGPEEAHLEADPSSSSSGSRSTSSNASSQGGHGKRFTVENEGVARLSGTFAGLLLTGEEGETRVSAVLRHGEAGRTVAEASMRVVVALPSSVTIQHGVYAHPKSRRSGSKKQVREMHQAALPSEAARMGYGRAAAAAAAAAAAGVEDQGSITVYAEHAARLHAALADAQGRPFSPPHLLMPSGPLEVFRLAEGVEEKRQREFGALASLPPAEAVHCVYTWEVRSGSGVLLLSPFDVPDEAPALHSAAAARLPAAPGGAGEEHGGALSWRGLKGQRRLQSRGLSEVALLGVGAGEALIGLAVNCSRRGRVVASVTAPELRVRVLPSPLPALLAPRAAGGFSGFISSLSPFLAAPVLAPLLATDAVYLLPCCSVQQLQHEQPAPTAPAAGAKGEGPTATTEQEAREACCAAAAAVAGNSKEAEAAAAATAAAAACCEGLAADCCEWSPRAAAAAAAENSAVFILSGSKGFIASPLPGQQGVLRLSSESSSAGSDQWSTSTSGFSSRTNSNSALVAVETADVQTLQVAGFPHLLQAGETEDFTVILRDQRGRIIATPSSILLDVLSSHPSVVSASVVTGPDGPLGPPAVRVKGLQRGCAAVWVYWAAAESGGDAQQRVQPGSAYRTCVDVTDGLLGPPPLAVLPGASLPLLQGARLPPALLPPSAALHFQVAFRAPPLLHALRAWRGPAHGDAGGVAATTAAAAASDAAAEAADWAPTCMSQEAAAALLRRLHTPLSTEVRRLLVEALMPADEMPQDNSLPPVAVEVRSLRLHENPIAAAAESDEGATNSFFFCATDEAAAAEAGAFVVVADIRIPNLPTAAAAAVSMQLAVGSKTMQAAAASPISLEVEAATLDSLPSAWRVDGVLLLLQQLWMGLARDWRKAQHAASVLLGPRVSGAGICCPSWSFPLAAFLSWDNGFEGLSIRSGSSKSCSRMGTLRSSDPSSLVIVGLANCMSGVGGPVAALAARPAPVVQLVQQGTTTAAAEIINASATAAVSGFVRPFRLLTQASCDARESVWQQQEKQQQQQWVDAEDLTLPRCLTGKTGGSLVLSFRMQALTPVEGIATSHYHEQQKREWQDTPFVSPAFQSRLSVHCRLSDRLLSRLYTVEGLSRPVIERPPGTPVGWSLSAEPLCIVRERQHLSVQEVQRLLQQREATRWTYTSEKMARLDSTTSPAATAQCEALHQVRIKNRQQEGSADQDGAEIRPVALLVSLSGPSSVLALRQEQQRQQQQQQEVFWTHCVRWPIAVPLRLLENEDYPGQFVTTDPSADATIRIKPAVQKLAFKAAASSSGGRLVAIPSVSSSSSSSSGASSKWPLELHVFPVLGVNAPRVRISDNAFALEMHRQGPLLTLRLSPSLEGSVAAAGAAGDAADASRQAIISNWRAPVRTEVVIENSSGGSRLLVVLNSSGVRTSQRVTTGLDDDEGEEAAPGFSETAAPPLLVFALVACLGAIGFWLFCGSSGAVNASKGKIDGSGSSQTLIGSPRRDEKGPYRTRAGKSAWAKYDGPSVQLMKSMGEGFPAYTLQPNGDWKAEEPLLRGPCSISSTMKSSTRFYDN